VDAEASQLLDDGASESTDADDADSQALQALLEVFAERPHLAIEHRAGWGGARAVAANGREVGHEAHVVRTTMAPKAAAAETPASVEDHGSHVESKLVSQ